MVQRILEALQDRDGDGSVSFQEFVHYVGKLGATRVVDGSQMPDVRVDIQG